MFANVKGRKREIHIYRKGVSRPFFALPLVGQTRHVKKNAAPVKIGSNGFTSLLDR